MSQESQIPDIETLLAKDQVRIKKELGEITEFTDMTFVPGKDEQVGYWVNLEEEGLVLARCSYGFRAPSMSTVYEDLATGHTKETGFTNRKAFLEQNGFRGQRVFQTRGQVIGDKPQILEVDEHSQEAVVDANVLFSRDPNVIMIIASSDCPTAVLSARDEHGNPVTGLLHGGAQSINFGLIRQGMQALQSEIGLDMSSAVVGIFPGMENYTLSRWFKDKDGVIKPRYEGLYPVNVNGFLEPAKTDDPLEKRRIDLLSAMEMQLLQAGMRAENILAVRRDTYADAQEGRVFSHRLMVDANGRPGANLIATQLRQAA